MTAASLVRARCVSPSATGPAPTLHTALRDIHQRWMRDTLRWLAPTLSASADFWDGWSAVRYINDQFERKYRRQRSLVKAILPLLRAADAPPAPIHDRRARTDAPASEPGRRAAADDRGGGRGVLPFPRTARGLVRRAPASHTGPEPRPNPASGPEGPGEARVRYRHPEVSTRTLSINGASWPHEQSRLHPILAYRARVGAWRPGPGGTTVSRLSYDPATNTVTFALEAGAPGTAGPFNFNGYTNGGATLVVPPKSTVVMNFVNHDGTPHSAEVIADAEPMPNMGGDPAIPRAYTRDVTQGIASGWDRCHTVHRPGDRDLPDLLRSPGARHLRHVDPAEGGSVGEDAVLDQRRSQERTRSRMAATKPSAA